MTDEEWSARGASFGNAAADYATGRPHYPREALDWALPRGARSVLDLGAGTGLLTQDLLDLGLAVTAVEPSPEMRALISQDATVLDGTGEAIPLADHSVDAVCVGQAWHWFDREQAMTETHRVLRPGGVVLLMWNVLDTSDPTTRAIATAIRDPLLSTIDDQAEPPLDWPGHFTTPERTVLPHVQGYDADRITSFTVSLSATIRLEPTDRDDLVARVLDATPEGGFPLNFLCEAWRATAL